MSRPAVQVDDGWGRWRWWGLSLITCVLGLGGCAAQRVVDYYPDQLGKGRALITGESDIPPGFRFQEKLKLEQQVGDTRRSIGLPWERCIVAYAPPGMARFYFNDEPFAVEIEEGMTTPVTIRFHTQMLYERSFGGKEGTASVSIKTHKPINSLWVGKGCVPYPPPQPPEPQPSDYLHDGFYVRFGVGAGWLAGTGSGVTVPTELSAGYSITRQLVLLGGAFNTTDVGNTRLSMNGGSVTPELFTTHLIGGGIEVYPDPTAGLHVELLLGMSLFQLSLAESQHYSGTGMGVGLGGGYEWWVSENWSLGFLGRVAYARGRVTGGDSSQGPGGIDLSAITLSVLLGVTYH